MAVDYMGPGFSNFASQLSNAYISRSNTATADFNTTQAIDYYKPQISSSQKKTVFGVPLYGHSFANTAGLG